VLAKRTFGKHSRTHLAAKALELYILPMSNASQSGKNTADNTRKALISLPQACPARANRSIWAIPIIVALTICAFIACLTLVWDSDVFWHLAGGDWMLAHHAVLDTDPFSIDPQPKWVNVHWLFQLTIAVLHSIGGFELLSVMKATLAAGAMFVLAIGLYRRVSPAWLGVCGLAMLAIIYDRVRVRPEAFTFVYLMLTIVLIDGVRRGGKTNRLWLLVPIMLLWVNMHGIYIIGLGLIWGSVLGAAIDRLLGRAHLSSPLLTKEAIGPMVLASLTCLVSPWPIEAAIQPLILWTRVSGQNEFYSYAVTELQPTWTVLKAHTGALGIVGCTCLAMILNFRKVPIGHVLWLAPFIFLALLARRNVSLLGPIGAFLLAWHGQGLIDYFTARWPGVKKIGGIAAVLTMLAIAATAVGFGTEYMYRRAQLAIQIGMGLQKEEFPIQLAEFLRDLPADGDIMFQNFGDAGAFIYYGSHDQPEPRRLVYMDGRLEAHSLDRFVSQQRISQELDDPVSAAAVKLPPTVRFIVVRQNAVVTLASLARCPRYKLIHVDDTAACFADTKYVGKSQLGQDLLNLGQYDRPLESAGYVQGGEIRGRTWYAQTPVPQNYRLGEMFRALGQYDKKRMQRPGAGLACDAVEQKCTLLAIRYLTASLNDCIMPRYISQGTLAMAYHQRAYEDNFTPNPALPIDVDSARALYLYNQINFDNLGDDQMLQFAMQRFSALFLAGQADASQEAMDQFMQHLPPRVQLSQPREFYDLRNWITQQVVLARGRSEQLLEGLDLAHRASVLARPDVGLINQAIAELRQSRGANPALQLALGDLLLRTGRVQEAMDVYHACKSADVGEAASPVSDSLSLRLALCAYVSGDLEGASGQLGSLYARTKNPSVAYYHARVLEELGLYEAAQQALADVQSPDEQLSALMNRLRSRL
jgi:tetratricopeptide (TPR) repeat protein